MAQARRRDLMIDYEFLGFDGPSLAYAEGDATLAGALRPGSRNRVMLAGPVGDARRLLPRLAEFPAGTWVNCTRGAVSPGPDGWAKPLGGDWIWGWHEPALGSPEPVPPEIDGVVWTDGADADEINAVLDASFPGASMRPGAARVAWWLGARDGDGRLLAVVAGAREAPGRRMWIASLGVLPSARGRGVGGALTLRAMARAESEPVEGRRLVDFGALLSEPRLPGFYRRLGFTIDRELTSFELR